MRDTDDGSSLSRQSFLALSVAGLAVVSLPVSLGTNRGTRTFTHSGREISVGTGENAELIVDGERLQVVSSNGAYRAVEFAFAPQQTIEDLGRRVAENAGRIAGRI